MNTIGTSLKKHKKLMLFILTIFLTGLIAGIIYYSKLQNNYKEEIEYIVANMNFNSNNILSHCIFLALICFLSIFLLGLVACLFFLFYEAMSIGLILATFSSIYGLSGFIFSIIYNILFKGVYLIFLTIILINVFNLTRHLIGTLFYKRDNDLKNMIINSFFKIVKASLIIVFYDVCLAIFGDNIIGIFSFLITK